MRRLAHIFPGVYTLLNLLMILIAMLGLGFQLWLAVLIPVIGFSFSLLHATQRMGGVRAALFLMLTISISLLFESVSVAWAWFYGPYHYTHRLGPLFLGLVPYLIPLSWFMMLYPSYVIADRILPAASLGPYRWLGVSAIGGLAISAWDLVLDPVMVKRGHWVWEVEGLYFGIPLQNYVGWWLTAFLILAIYQSLQSRIVPTPAPPRDSGFDQLAVLFYLLVGLGQAADAWWAGLSAPAVIAGALMGIWFMLGWRGNTKRSTLES